LMFLHYRGANFPTFLARFLVKKATPEGMTV
jgi:hypothetical protein